MSGTSVSAFSADALTTNQAGRLTDQQRQAYRGQDRSFRKSELTGAIGAIVFGILFLTAAGPNPNAWLRPVLAVVAFVIAGFLLFRATIASDSLSRDLSRGVVASVDGAILKNVRSSGGQSSSSSYYIPRGRQEFRCLSQRLPGGARSGDGPGLLPASQQDCGQPRTAA